MFESLPIFASVISTCSRAGLNVVDRKQFQRVGLCPLEIGYWNNLLPIILIAPFVILTPALDFLRKDILSFEAILLAVLIQLSAYSYGYCFKKLRVTDLAVLSKSADISVPLILAISGLYPVPIYFFLLLPATLYIFVLCAGINAVKYSYQSSIFLILALTIQGIYLYFLGIYSELDKNIWTLISLSFSVLIWRFIFSGFVLIYRKRVFFTFIVPENTFSCGTFYLRGFLTALTQVAYILSISSDQLLIVWPILNATGFVGAVFAHLFLGEKLSGRDFTFISFAFFITLLVVVSLNYEKP